MFPKFSIKPKYIKQVSGKKIYVFEQSNSQNIDKKTILSFSNEWKKFSSFPEQEIFKIGYEYFDIALNKINNTFKVLDVGCGMGRWSYYVADKVKTVDAIDPSDAVYSAASLLKEKHNVRISNADVDNIPFENNTFDLVFSFGVLHHIPNTFNAMKNCVDKVKPGGYFLVYLYYNLDNRGIYYKWIFKASNFIRLIVSKMPFFLRNIICEILTILIYLPLILLARILKFLKIKWYHKIPLSYYCEKSFKVIRNDVYDRFATPLEKRFSKKEIQNMMEKCGLVDIQFSDKMPYWHAIGRKTH